MRCVVQRVASSSVTSEGVLAGQIGPGLMVLIGVSVDDTEADVKYMAEKIPNLRIFGRPPAFLFPGCKAGPGRPSL